MSNINTSSLDLQSLQQNHDKPIHSLVGVNSNNVSPLRPNTYKIDDPNMNISTPLHNSKKRIQISKTLKNKLGFRQFNNLDLNKCINKLIYGMNIKKSTRNGNGNWHLVYFYLLEDDMTILQWLSNKKPFNHSRIKLKTVLAMTDLPSRTLGKNINRNSRLLLAIQHADGELVLNFDNELDKNEWWNGLQYFIDIAFNEFDQIQEKNSVIASYFFHASDKQGNKKLDKEEMLDALKRMHIYVSKKFAMSFFRNTDLDKDGELDYQEFLLLIKKLSIREELLPLYQSYCEGYNANSNNEKNYDIPYMKPQELQKFFEHEQKQIINLEEIIEIIKESKDEGDITSNNLSFRNFISIMYSDLHNSIFNSHYVDPYQDMDQPLSDYYINSSHNTYLIANQLTGESSVNSYINALRGGFRLVELDLWNGDDEPIVYHGHTLTSKILFRDVCRAVKKYGFEANPYPIIFSFEMHCDTKGKKQIANILKQELGDLIYYLPKDFDKYETFPSPNALRNKIIIKGKRNLKDIIDDNDNENDDDNENDTNPNNPNHTLIAINENTIGNINDKDNANINGNEQGNDNETNINNNNVNSNVNSNTNSNVNANSNVNSNVNGNSNANSNANANNNGNSIVNTNSNANDNGNSNVNANNNANSKVNVNSNANSNVKANSNGNIKVNSNRKVNGNSNDNDNINNNGNGNGGDIGNNNVNDGGNDNQNGNLNGNANEHTNINGNINVNDNHKANYSNTNHNEYPNPIGITKSKSKIKNTNLFHIENIPESDNNNDNSIFSVHVDKNPNIGFNINNDNLDCNINDNDIYNENIHELEYLPSKTLREDEHEIKSANILLYTMNNEKYINPINKSGHHYHKRLNLQNLNQSIIIEEEKHITPPRTSERKKVTEINHIFSTENHRIESNNETLNRSSLNAAMIRNQLDMSKQKMNKSAAVFSQVKQPRNSSRMSKPPIMIEQSKEMKDIKETQTNPQLDSINTGNLNSLNFPPPLKGALDTDIEYILGINEDHNEYAENIFIDSIGPTQGKDTKETKETKEAKEIKDKDISSIKEKEKTESHSEEINTKSTKTLTKSETKIMLKSKVQKDDAGGLQELYSMISMKWGLKNERTIWHVSSISENKFAGLYKNNYREIVDFHRKYITKIYPSGMRITSSNYNPIPCWNVGIQIVALNCQTADEPMFLNFAKFIPNGMCGYVLKPKFLQYKSLKSSQFSTQYPNEITKPTTTLKIKIISGKQLRGAYDQTTTHIQNDIVDPYVEIKIRGTDIDEQNNQLYRTHTIQDNGFNPIWSNQYKECKAVFNIAVPDLCNVIFIVRNENVFGSNIVGWYCIELKNMVTGYRAVPLYDKNFQQIHHSYIFCHIEIEGYPYITQAKSSILWSICLSCNAYSI